MRISKHILNMMVIFSINQSDLSLWLEDIIEERRKFCPVKMNKRKGVAFFSLARSGHLGIN